MFSRSFKYLVKFVPFILLLLGAGSVHAQDLTGTLYGEVMDESGLLVPGATVTVSSPQLIQGVEVRVTTATGTYRVPNLPPGTYSVKAELPGFQTVTRAAIVLPTGASLAIDFMLKLSPVAETITVTGESPLVDVKSTNLTRHIDSAVVDNIPVARNFAALLETAPGVLDSEYGFSPAQTVHGSSVRDNVYNLDGASANDNAVGYMFSDIPYDIIEEVQITSGGISAEYGQAAGAVFSFITKSGGNDFSGGGNFFIVNEALQGSNLTEELLAQVPQGTEDIRNLDFGVYGGGPVIKDRIWFFGNLRRLDVERTQPDFTAQNPTITENQYFIKGTVQVNASNKIQGSYTQRDFTLFPGNAGFATNDNPETWSTSFRPFKIAYLTWTSLLTENTFLDASYSINTARFNTTYDNFDVGYRDIATGKLSGGITGPIGPTLNRDTNYLRASVSTFQDAWGGRSHNLKVGVDYAYVPFAWTRTVPGDMVHVLDDGRAHRIRLYNTPTGFLGLNVTRYAGYVQDEWTLNDRVTLNLGVRFESNEGWAPEQHGGGGQWFPRVDFAEVRDQIKWFNTAPRLGLIWDATGDQRTSVKFSYSRYYVAALSQHVFNGVRNSSSFQELDWIDRNGDLFFQDGEQGTLRRDILPNTNIFDPDLKQPYVDEFYVGVDWQIKNNLSLSVAGIVKRERNLMETIDLSKPFSEAYNPISVTNPIDGQEMTIFALDPAFQGVQRIRTLTNPTDPITLVRDYKGIDLVLRKRMSDGWQFEGSLVLSRSEGNTGNSFGASTGGRPLYDNPNTLINIDGPLDLDTPVQLKFAGTYAAPYDILVSAFYSGISGFPIKPPSGFPTDVLGAYTVRFTPADNPGIVSESFIDVAGQQRGTNRTDFRHKLSFRAEKEFVMGNVRLGFIADVFNLFNISTVTAVQTLRFDHPNFLKPAIIEQPRTLRLGIRINY